MQIVEIYHTLVSAVLGLDDEYFQIRLFKIPNDSSGFPIKWVFRYHFMCYLFNFRFDYETYLRAASAKVDQTGLSLVNLNSFSNTNY
jgi:hypothetical protein